MPGLRLMGACAGLAVRAMLAALSITSVAGAEPAGGTTPSPPPVPGSVARPGTWPADFGLTLDLQANRKFTANDVRAFVHHVFSMYERATNGTPRVGPEAFRPLLDDNVQIDFPDYKIRSWQDFVQWHRWIHGQLVGDEHVVGPIDVRFLNDGRYEAHFTVLWRALFKTGKYSEVRVEQTWTMREQADRDLPVIETYVARVADFRALN